MGAQQCDFHCFGDGEILSDFLRNGLQEHMKEGDSRSADTYQNLNLETRFLGDEHLLRLR